MPPCATAHSRASVIKNVFFIASIVFIVYLVSFRGGQGNRTPARLCRQFEIFAEVSGAGANGVEGADEDSEWVPTA